MDPSADMKKEGACSSQNLDRWADLMVQAYEPLARQNLDAFTRGATLWQLAGGILGTTVNDRFELYEIDIGMCVEPDAQNVGTFNPRIWKKVWPVTPPGPIMVMGGEDRHLVLEFAGRQTDRAAIAMDKWIKSVREGQVTDIDSAGLEAGIRFASDNAVHKNEVGGPVDILELRRGGKADWVKAKPQCKSDLRDRQR
jgi:hypothetical protein